jgi:hypothetical protein
MNMDNIILTMEKKWKSSRLRSRRKMNLLEIRQKNPKSTIIFHLENLRKIK